MSDISVIGNAVVGSIQSTAAPTTQKALVEVVKTTKESVVATEDRVEFSQIAQMLEKIHQLPAVRQERIDEIQEALSNETYMTSDKLDVAFDRLIDEVAR